MGKFFTFVDTVKINFKYLIVSFLFYRFKYKIHTLTKIFSDYVHTYQYALPENENMFWAIPILFSEKLTKTKKKEKQLHDLH